MSDYYDGGTDDDDDYSWVIWVIIAGLFACIYFGGCESDADKEKKKQRARIEQLEVEVDYLINKIDKRKW